MTEDTYLSPMVRRARSKPYYNVVPRYTAGSPAAVDEATGERVAKEERAAYERLMTGWYGDEEKRRAERLGLEGIVYQFAGRQKRPQVTVYDVVTETHRYFDRWPDFASWSNQNREASAAQA